MSSKKNTRSSSQSIPIKKQIRKYSKESDFDQSSSSEDSNKIVKKRYVKLWKPEEDELLQKFYKVHSGNWALIAAEITDRNPSQCSQRWKRINPNRIKVRKQWTEEEDNQVLKLIQKFGKNWKRIENEMVGRSGKQIRERFINKLDQTINHGQFTESEDLMIYNQYIEQGPKWSEISKHLTGRPENMVKNRFYSHIRKYIIQKCKNNKNLKIPLRRRIKVKNQLINWPLSKVLKRIWMGLYHLFYLNLRKKVQKYKLVHIIVNSLCVDLMIHLDNFNLVFVLFLLNFYKDSFGSNNGAYKYMSLEQQGSLQLQFGNSQEYYGNIQMPTYDQYDGHNNNNLIEQEYKQQPPIPELKILNSQMQHMSLESNNS